MMLSFHLLNLSAKVFISSNPRSVAISTRASASSTGQGSRPDSKDSNIIPTDQISAAKYRQFRLLSKKNHHLALCLPSVWTGSRSKTSGDLNPLVPVIFASTGYLMFLVLEMKESNKTGYH